MGQITALILSLTAIGLVTLGAIWLGLVIANSVRTQYHKWKDRNRKLRTP